MSTCHEDQERIKELQEEIDKLTDQHHTTTKKHNDMVEWLERLIALALALGRAKMTQEELENALKKLEDEALEESADAMAWAGRESLRRNK
jgi:DNA primase large subunit